MSLLPPRRASSPPPACCPLRCSAQEELTRGNALQAHAIFELGIDPARLANPCLAAASSAVSFAVGAAIPLLAAAFIEDACRRLLAGVVAAAFGFAAFGALAAHLGASSKARGVARVLLGGMAELGVTYCIGGGIAAAQGRSPRPPSCRG